MDISIFLIIGGVAVAALFGLLLVVALVLVARRRSKIDPEAGLAEELAGYPAPPPTGTHRLKFESQPVRIRLVVLASGRSTDLNADMAEGLLQSIVHGLGEVADLDKPRVKVWPPQLSQNGFAPTFFRHVKRPEPAGQPSKWILIAGPAKVGGRAVLVGMALSTTEPTARGNVRMREDDWADKLRIQFVD
jgi:hypothetical protein